MNYNIMSSGYIYCLSNPSMIGILKIGMTERRPENRARELFSTGVPSPYKIEFAKKVINHKSKELVLHKLLAQYSLRVSPNREFFKISIEEVKAFFDLIDGEEWVEFEKQNIDIEEFEENSDSEDNNYNNENEKGEKKCRDLSKCLFNNQPIRHIIGINKIWEGKYNLIQKCIIFEEKVFKGKSPLNQFATEHYSIERNDRTSSCNAWLECECKINDNWVSTYNLPVVNNRE
jgi:hypothetical protein